MKTAALALLVLVAAPAWGGCGDRPGPGLDWSGCTKTRLVLKGKDLKRANLERAVLLGVDFTAADLGGASFRGAEINHASFSKARLQGASFEKAVAVRADFSGARFAGASLEKAEFHRSDLSGAALGGVSLAKGDFGRSVFGRARSNLIQIKAAGHPAPRIRAGGTRLSRGRPAGAESGR